MRIKKSIIAIMLIVVCAFVCPNMGYASEEMSDEFKAILTDGKLVVPSVKPTTEDEAWVFVNAYLKNNFSTDNGVWLEGWFEGQDFSKVTIHYGVLNLNRVDVSEPFYKYEEKHTVDVEYKYTEKPQIKQKVLEYVNRAAEKDSFELRDLEIINYWLYGYDENDRIGVRNQTSMANYSSEFRGFLNYSNISAQFDEPRAGANTELFNTYRSPIAFCYDGIYYGGNAAISMIIKSIIYVPNDVEDTPEMLLQAAQKRINDYLKTDTAVVLNYGGLFSEADQHTSASEHEEFLNISGVEHYFVANVNGEEHKLLIIPNSEKMYTPTYKTIDLDTNVEINTDSSSVPLDTLVQVDKIEDGKDFEKIKDILRFHNTDSFDLKLHSFSGNRYIEKLDNGNFRVRIPIKEELKGKKLSVYYIDDNGKKHEHEVKIEGDYACFDTNHFSIYTLADTESVITDNVTNETSPKTGDGTNTTLWILLLGVASIMLVYCNKQKMRGIKNVNK